MSLFRRLFGTRRKSLFDAIVEEIDATYEDDLASNLKSFREFEAAGGRIFNSAAAANLYYAETHPGESIQVLRPWPDPPNRQEGFARKKLVAEAFAPELHHVAEFGGGAFNCFAKAWNRVWIDG